MPFTPCHLYHKLLNVIHHLRFSGNDTVVEKFMMFQSKKEENDKTDSLRAI